MRDDGLHGVLRQPHPLLGPADILGAEVLRDDLRLEDVHQLLALLRRARRRVEVRAHRFDRETVVAGVAFRPPAVEHRHVDDAVDAGLHAGGTAGLHRVFGSVQPDVTALHQVAREVQVVAFDHDQAADQIVFHRRRIEFPDQRLTGLVARVGLAGEDHQHRPLRVVEQTCDAFAIAQDQGGPLVGRESTREPDDNSVGVGLLHETGDPADDRLGCAIAPVLFAEAFVHVDQQVALELLPDRDEAVVRNLVDRVPVAAVEQVLGPLREMVVQQLYPQPCHEGVEVDAVGDRVHRIFARLDLRPDVAFGVGRDQAVDLRDAVDEARAA